MVKRIVDWCQWRQWRPLALLGIALLGLLLRLYGLNWDQGNNFHPDERQILFHVVSLSWPTSLGQFLNPASSPLNPHFFAYGSFPLYLLALLGKLVIHDFTQPGAFVRLTLLGRALSAVFDSGTILLSGLLGLALSKNTTPDRSPDWRVGLLAAGLVAFTPLQIQLAHFFVVDSLLLFFVMLTLLACVQVVESSRFTTWLIVAGVGYGLAMATKFSALPLVVPLLLALYLRWYRQKLDILSFLLSFCYTCALAVLIFFIAQPYALLDWQNYISQIVQQDELARGSMIVPYTIQFAGTIPFVYEAYNMVLWGMGVTLGVASFAGLLWVAWRALRRDAGSWLVPLAWVLVYGGINCTFYVKYMRYMLPVYPVLAVMGAAALFAFVRWLGQHYSTSSPFSKHSKYSKRLAPALQAALVTLVLAGTMFQGLALLNVYSEPNTRVQASVWMYQHLPAGSVLTYEQWDDALPVSVGNHTPYEFVQATYAGSNGQTQTGLDLYGDDTTAKARQLAALLPKINAITMATDRLDKSIPRLPQRYPLTIHYYQLLFSGQLGFHLAAQFDNRPYLLGITLNDSGADESYSVFDHPTVRIFVRETPYPYTPNQLYQKLLAGVQLPATS